MRITNTMSGKKEEFIPSGETMKMYVCGPTPYDACHVGHAMSYIVFDVVRRYLEYAGYRVKHVQNFTDIEDKIISRARELRVTPQELSERYIAEFLEDMEALNMRPAHIYPRATGETDKMIELILGLLSKGYAYIVDGDVYFRVQKASNYGKLSHRTLDAMQAGARVEIDQRKEHPMDFALWKSAKEGEPAWPSPWGPGRPGWHIECSAMSLKYLGEQVDIHGGGQDLIFPHHENEMAQSESYTGKVPFVRYWLHNGLLQLGQEKMSKSLGNLVTVREMLGRHSADAFRLFVLSSHYRSPITYSEEALDSAERGLERLLAALYPLSPIGLEASQVEETSDVGEQLDRAKQAFVQAMEDDFNTPVALASLFELAKEINRWREQGAPDSLLAPAQLLLMELGGVLGFSFKRRERRPAEIDPLINLMIEIRQELRQAKQWALADRIRDRLASLGITLEDGATGTTWRYGR